MGPLGPVGPFLALRYEYEGDCHLVYVVAFLVTFVLVKVPRPFSHQVVLSRRTCVKPLRQQTLPRSGGGRLGPGPFVVDE